MTSERKFLVVAREHANLDSLPLRFGIHFSVDTIVEVYGSKDLGVDDRFSDRHHYEGYLKDLSKPGAKGLFGHFVVGYRKSGNYWSLVTAWRGSSKEDEYFLSNTLRNLREDGILNSSMLLQMHPHYENGEINTSAALISYLSKSLAQNEIKKAKESEERARVETEQAIKEMNTAKEAAVHARSVAIEAIEVVETLEARVTKAEQAEQEARSLLAEAMAAIKRSEANEKRNTSSTESDAAAPARAVTAQWQSKTGSDYRNVGLEAIIVGVSRRGEKIGLTYIGKDGVEKSIEDFGYQGFKGAVFDYLDNRKGKRAVFLVTQKPGKAVMLASDTMMLPTYKGLWA